MRNDFMNTFCQIRFEHRVGQRAICAWRVSGSLESICAPPAPAPAPAAHPGQSVRAPRPVSAGIKSRHSGHRRGTKFCSRGHLWTRGGGDLVELLNQRDALLLDLAPGLRPWGVLREGMGGRCCGDEVGSYLRLMDSCITQLEAQGPSRTCCQSKKEEEVWGWRWGDVGCRVQVVGGRVQG